MSTSQPYPVLLIATNVERDPYPVFPIGAAIIAAALRDQGYAVRGLDFAFLDGAIDATLKTIHEFKPQLIGISIRAVDNTCLVDQRTYLPAIRELIAAIRNTTSTKIVIGGSGYSLFPELILNYLKADFGIAGEGEATIVELTRYLQGERDQQIAGLFTRNGEAIGNEEIGSKPGPPPLSIDQWRRPALEIFPLEKHLEAGGMASVQTKRGCPLKCSYCTYPLLEGRSMRLRPPAEIVDEINNLKEQGVGYLFFVDNNFNIPAQHALDICTAMAKENAIINWTAFLTPYRFDQKLADAMAAAGARSVEFGSESAAKATLEGLGKHHNAADIVNADKLCIDAGVTPAHFFIFGGPGETEETVEENLAVIESLKGPTAATFAIRIYPRTGLHARAIEEGLIDPSDPLLDPAYYISPHIDAEAVIERLNAVAEKRRNFFLLGSDSGVDKEIIKRLRQRGRKGPLWEYLRA